MITREADLLLGLAQRGLEERLVAVAPAAGEGDLAGVPAQVRASLGEDQAGVVGPAVHRHQDRGLGAAVRLESLGLHGVEKQAGQIR